MIKLVPYKTRPPQNAPTTTTTTMAAPHHRRGRLSALGPHACVLALALALSAVRFAASAKWQGECPNGDLIAPPHREYDGHCGSCDLTCVKRLLQTRPVHTRGVHTAADTAHTLAH